MTRITSGTGTVNAAAVTSDNRLKTDTISEPISTERSRQGLLFGTGTGSVSVTSGMSLAPVLWLKNSGTDYDFYVQKLIFGWNGGSTNFNRTILSFIKYQTTQPTTNTADASPAVENISKSGSTSAVTDPDATALKWDGGGADVGMTGGSGGYLQIPNRLAQGNTSIPIDGEIILGPGDAMEMQVTPEQDGLYNVAIVYYKVLVNTERGD